MRGRRIGVCVLTRAMVQAAVRGRGAAASPGPLPTPAPRIPPGPTLWSSIAAALGLPDPAAGSPSAGSPNTQASLAAAGSQLALRALAASAAAPPVSAPSLHVLRMRTRPALPGIVVRRWDSPSSRAWISQCDIGRKERAPRQKSGYLALASGPVL